MYRIYGKHIVYDDEPVARISGRMVEFFLGAEDVRGFSYCEVTAFLDRTLPGWKESNPVEARWTFQQLREYLRDGKMPLISRA